MSLDNIPPPKLPANDEPNTSADGGASGGRKTSLMKPPEQTLKCPRCDSPNTKFCYYNNYSLTQPRHFCKTCRRYWTKGGALRSVPIGGGCRKSRKSRSSSSRFINGDSSSKSSSLDMGELSLFKGFNPPAMDYQLGGLNQLSSTPMINPPPFLNLDSLGLNFPLVKQDIHQHFQEIGVSNNLASSIESLSSINQDLHWKLQQQRLAALFNGGASGSGGGGGGGGGGVIEQQSQTVMESQAQKLQPMFFQNLEIPKASQTSMTAEDLRIDDQSGDLQTEWFFDGSYAPVNVDPMTTNGNNSGNYDNGSMSNWSNGIQGSNQFNQYNALQ